MKHCIFHYPEPICDTPGIGSALRPNQMLAAFRAIGYEVDEITGYSEERREKIRIVMKKISQGVKFDFVYSESINCPLLLADADHIPRHPTMDYKFFAYCKKRGIPVGLFYRDIHWMYPLYKKAVSFWKRSILVPMFRYDLRKYRKLLDILYVPSKQMGDKLPKMNMEILPPGGMLHLDVLKKRKERVYTPGKLKVFYVGNVTGGVYNIKVLCEAISKTPGTELVICCPEEAWEKAKEDYLPYMCTRVQIIHKKSFELKPYFEDADIFACCLENNEYVQIAMPIKVFEASGYGIPVLITKGVAAAEIIRNEEKGWSTEYSLEAIAEMLALLRDHPDRIKKAVERTIEFSTEHTWESRAKKVAEDLTNVKR